MKPKSGPEMLTMAQPPDSSETVSSVKDAATLMGTAVPPSSRQMIEALIGKTVDGRYVIEEPIGAGGMGVVYKARHKVIGKQVAMKVLRGEMAEDHEMTERFLNEARAASSIGNPHIVDISDFGRLEDGSAYFVMEYLVGTSLMDLMQSLRVIPVGRIIHIGRQIARALAAAHARGIVHRDLKPDNVMLVPRGDDKDFVKILDFGIAKVGHATSRLTKAGSVFGTPHYMSPEQAAGTEVTHATDVYSLGIILYEMASGKVPFDADNFMGILTQHMYKAPVHLRTLVPAPQEIPVGLDAIVQKCLAKKPEQRYASMDELVADLDRAERGMIPEAVNELMARSGGFHVPADYFRSPERGGAMIPGSPSFTRNKSLLGVIIGASLLFAIVGIGFLIAALRNKSQAAVPPPTASIEPSATATAAPPPTVASAESTPPSPKVRVSIQVDPIPNAPVWNGDTLLGPFAFVELGPDETARISAEAAGFKRTTTECKANAPKGVCTIKLERPDVAPRPALPATGKKPLVCPPGQRPDPWGKACEKPL